MNEVRRDDQRNKNKKKKKKKLQNIDKDKTVSEQEAVALGLDTQVGRGSSYSGVGGWIGGGYGGYGGWWWGQWAVGSGLGGRDSHQSPQRLDSGLG